MLIYFFGPNKFYFIDKFYNSHGKGKGKGKVNLAQALRRSGV